MKTGIFYKERGLNGLKQVTTSDAGSDIDFVQDQMNAMLEIKKSTGQFTSGPILCLIITDHK